MVHKFVDITGQIFNRLTAIKYVGLNKQRKSLWLFKCRCGNKKVLRYTAVKIGQTKSCGCLRDETVSFMFSTHRQSETKTFRIWAGMKQRCSNPKNKWYHRYGGRGIKVCKRWLKFENFFKDMGSCPSLKHSIDRINNNRGYSKSNCRWATAKEQASNRVRSKHF